MTAAFPLPPVLPGHWSSPEGQKMAQRYAAKTRNDLAMGDQTDLSLANAVYLVGREDLDLLSFPTAAKERIRWLSVQLALAEIALASRSPRPTREQVMRLVDPELFASLDSQAGFPPDSLEAYQQSRLRAAGAAADALLALWAVDDPWIPTHRHLKRRTDYQVVGSGRLQTAVSAGAWDDLGVTIYRAADGSWWVRPTAEFNDGRFEALAPPSPQAGEQNQ